MIYMSVIKKCNQTTSPIYEKMRIYSFSVSIQSEIVHGIGNCQLVEGLMGHWCNGNRLSTF